MDEHLPIRCRAEEVAEQLRLVVRGLPFLADRSWEEVGWGQMRIELLSLWRVELLLEAANPVVDADKIHLTNVAYNLMDNAMKYAKSQPHLTISTAQLPDGLMIKFKDNGIGIAKEHLGKVFDRLYRVPTGNVHDVKGFGLGLSYVKTVVERHGGEITVESEPGKGSTFILRMPRHVGTKG